MSFILPAQGVAGRAHAVGNILCRPHPQCIDLCAFRFIAPGPPSQEQLLPIYLEWIRGVPPKGGAIIQTDVWNGEIAMPWVNVDFYMPIGSDKEYVDLRAALIAAGETNAANRLRERGETYRLFLSSVEMLNDGSVMGTAARVRMHGLPGKFRGTDFSLNDLDLAETDGVAEEVSFLISHELQTIALQRNGGFRSTGVEAFLVEMTDIPMALEPKIRVDKLSRLNGIEEFSEVSFKLAQPLNDTDFDDTLPGVGKTIKDAAQIGTLATVELTIRLRTGEDNPQDVGTIRKLLKKLDGREDAVKLSAKGRRPNSKIEPIDLIRDRIVAGDHVEYGNGRRLDGEQCRLLLRKAMSTNQLFLASLLGKQL